MAEQGSIVVVGGSSGLGLEIARHYAQRDRAVVVTSRDQQRAAAAAEDIGGRATPLVVDLSEPARLAEQLAGIEAVDALVLSGVDRDENSVREFDVESATRLVVLKLVGYTEAVHVLAPRMTERGSVVLFGGLAKDRPYPGSTTVTTVNGGVTGMVRTLAVELAPIRVNAIHPGVVGDTPYWQDKPSAVLDALVQRTPLGRLVTTAEIVHAVAFLIENSGVNGVNLDVDGGWLLR
jgi:NAD(P)-dependent dehydrogenase (short-subunit alcohol dehydrogenase family)